jgi:hypothetical protein
MTINICMWSGPRNLSTAMMRSFENRADCAVFDEPFFAPYLVATGNTNPMREETIAAHETDPNVVAAICAGPAPTGEAVFFQKHMPHHVVEGFDRSWMKKCKHFILLRDPAAVIASYARGRSEFTLHDIGIMDQLDLYDEISDWANKPPLIVESNDILSDPERYLSAICAYADIPFDNAMLKWPAGPRDSDGVWAPHWYHSVANSTEFGPSNTEKTVVPDTYNDMLAQCQPAYGRLSALKITLK